MFVQAVRYCIKPFSRPPRPHLQLPLRASHLQALELLSIAQSLNLLLCATVCALLGVWEHCFRPFHLDWLCRSTALLCPFVDRLCYCLKHYIDYFLKAIQAFPKLPSLPLSPVFWGTTTICVLALPRLQVNTISIHPSTPLENSQRVKFDYFNIGSGLHLIGRIA